MNILDFSSDPQDDAVTYPHRVCLALTARHLDPSGGISNFVLGLVKMLPDTMFDLVTDDATEAQKWFGILSLGRLNIQLTHQ
jgi:hypothetical protein